MSTVLHDAKNYLKINEVWAFISVDDEGNEGLCAAPIGNGAATMPLIAADKKMLEILRPVAKGLALMTKKKIKLIKLHGREDVEFISPTGEWSTVQ
jgi:hypothetical protein